MRGFNFRKIRAAVVIATLAGSLLNAPTAEALFLKTPGVQWGHIYAGTNPITTTTPRTKFAVGTAKSSFNVTYNNFPEWAKKEFQGAVDIWSTNFASTVPISVDASWGRSSSWGILGSARPVNFFSSFAGAPDPSLCTRRL